MDNPIKTDILTGMARSIAAKEAFVKQSADDIIRVAGWIQASLEQGGTLLLFGNGGSAADAQHLAAEFVNRFLINRRPLAALALTTDSSILTAVANDFSYEMIFSKQIEALGKPEDLALGISTSGNSPNVIKGIEAARVIGMKTVGLTGGTLQPGGKLTGLCDLVLNVPSDFTPHIQESHLWVEHILCEIIEKQMFGSSQS